MTIWDFASKHWFVALLMLWSTFGMIKFLIRTPFRAMNIRKHGWPPAPLDADGDVHHKPKEEKA